MKKNVSLLGLLLASASTLAYPAWAQETGTLHVARSTVNAETENAELCLEFDKPLAATSRAHLASALEIESGGAAVLPSNIVTTETTLCLFPLDRGKTYRLSVKGLRGANDEKIGSPFRTSFVIPDRSPSLTFIGKTGGVNEFGSYDDTLTLRSVNVPRVKIDVYRITDPALMARAWQDRAETALAPSESAYAARSKGQTILRRDHVFKDARNTTVESKIVLRDEIPDLAPGLYLIVADAGDDNSKKPASKGLAPLAAAWFTKSDFSVQALRDPERLYVFASKADETGPKNDISLALFDKQPELRLNAQVGSDGIGTIDTNKTDNVNETQTLVATDKAGNVAFASIKSLEPLSDKAAPGSIHVDRLFAAPLSKLEVALTLRPTEKNPTVLRVAGNGNSPRDEIVPPMASENVKAPVITPASQSTWTLRWQKEDGSVLAEAPLRVTSNPDAPHLTAEAGRDALTSDGTCAFTIQSVSASGKPVGLAGGKILASWRRLDPEALGWKDYRFGVPAALPGTFLPVGDFVTDVAGVSETRVTLPPAPAEKGLYQVELKIVADPDSGIADAETLVLPLRVEGSVVGIKPLAPEARFPQNGLARFALIVVASDGKARDASGFSYQLYEEGRSFEWYQDEGRWQYAPEAQLRPIGGGPLLIKADASSVLELPVTAGNYRLEILDGNGKALAQTTFSAGWDSAGTELQTLPLNVTLPKRLQAGREAVAQTTLPDNAMVTVVVSDTRIRKVSHAFREKGPFTFAFTPEADWMKAARVNIEAVSHSKTGATVVHQASAEAPLIHGDNLNDTAPSNVPLIVTEDPAALVLRKDQSAGFTLSLANNEAEAETYRYTLNAAPGLKVATPTEGSVTLAPGQTHALAIGLSGSALGVKDMRFEVSNAHGTRVSAAWPISVLPSATLMRSSETLPVAPRQNLLTDQKKREGGFVFVARRPMDGVAEGLTYLFNTRPFTTEETALYIDALRLWGPTIEKVGLAPDVFVSALRKEYLAHLLKHQNADGGFANLRGNESSMIDTASALMAMASLTDAETTPAKVSAVNWLKQRLGNTWLDENEREPRAAAYAALAAAGAVDMSSLHYFSDTNAGAPISALASARMAAAFKAIHDPDAAAFWIKKMLDQGENAVKTPPVLRALAATDALSSDNVVAVTKRMGETLRKNEAVESRDVANVLFAAAVNNNLAGKVEIAIGNETRTFAGASVVKLSEPAMPRNGGPDNLYVTYVAEKAFESMPLPQEATLTRHIYRMNGVELAPPAKPVRGEMYMVEYKGEVPSADKETRIIVQDGGALRPLGCPLSPHLDTLSFTPWFATRNLSPVDACEYSAHALGMVLNPDDNDRHSYSAAAFVRIDAESTANIMPPTLRILSK